MMDPEIANVVLHRRAGEGDPVVRRGVPSAVRGLLGGWGS